MPAFGQFVDQVFRFDLDRAGQIDFGGNLDGLAVLDDRGWQGLVVGDADRDLLAIGVDDHGPPKGGDAFAAFLFGLDCAYAGGHFQRLGQRLRDGKGGDKVLQGMFLSRRL